ncbi:DUF3658 domain-containing protein [Pseudomonas sediminis]|uniref:DUF3658 domain-containing protein n=1 Tax=Pseudomonas sediminis TaxID=1691904 RepID=UPI001837CFDD|nr:DUF3658 domain-containing protein [Pseudomonas sediminis]
MTPRPDFSTGLIEDACWLTSLAGQDRPVAVWHGDSSSEQLLLARVASALQGSSVELWEVACGNGDSRVQMRKTVAMHNPETLAQIAQPRLVDANRRAALAAQWREAATEDATIRRWQAGTFSGESYQAIDAALVNSASAQAQPLARIMAEAMAHNDGFFATDFFLLWRAHELAAAGQLALSGEPGEYGYQGLQVRRA